MIQECTVLSHSDFQFMRFKLDIYIYNITELRQNRTPPEEQSIRCYRHSSETYIIGTGAHLSLPLPRWMPKITIRILSAIFLVGKLYLSMI